MRVAGLPVRNAARRVTGEEPVQVAATEGERYASRGGAKLAGALARFHPPVAGARVLDLGASTGGFTDCLLRHGAAEVVAVDVGRGLLDWRLRTDPRVRLLERTNARDLTPEAIGGPTDGAVADLSFISLRHVATALARCTAPAAWFVLLVKPQFEAGPRDVGRGGVVRDPGVRRRVLDEVVEALGGVGIVVVDAAASVLPGPAGNREVFVYAHRAGPPPPDLPLRLDRAVAEGEP